MGIIAIGGDKMQIDRLFEIIYILLNRNKVTATELAKELAVSRRTICRDIDTLSLAGIPIYTEKGQGGGISLLPDFVLNKSILSEQEQNDILSALHGLSNIGISDTSQLLQKVSATFNKAATNWLDVDFSDWHSEDDFFNDFKSAIVKRQIIEFNYYNSYGEKTFRRIEPIQLRFKYKSWYLKGFCLTKQGIRLYKLSRIKNLVLTDEAFSEREFPVAIDNPIKNTDERQDQEVTLKLRIEPEMTYRVHDDFHESIVEKQPDGSFIATVTFTEDNWVYGFLLSYGKHIEVLEPERIRNLLKDEAQNIVKKYL